MEVFSLIPLLLGLAGGICAIILPILLFVALGIFLYRRGQQRIAVKQAAQTWSSTMGTVVSSSVQTRHTGRSHSTFPVVVYQYEVNGKTYQSQMIKAGEQFMNIRVIGEAQTTVTRYPIGASVKVYYNPENPAESALER
jgi:uncharacterized protein DUF3592